MFFLCKDCAAIALQGDHNVREIARGNKTGTFKRKLLCW